MLTRADEGRIWHHARDMNDRPPRIDVSPKQVPDVRLALLSGWHPGGLFEAISARVGFQEPGAWERAALAAATLWWVSEEMVDVLVAAMPGVPDDVIADDLLEPADAGFVVFERPLTAIDREGRRIAVSALLWAGVQLDPNDPTVLRGGEVVLGISSYVDGATARWIHGVHGDPDAYSPPWGYLGRSDWPDGDPIVSEPYEGMSTDAATSAIEDRRMLAALWTFLTQEGVATTSEVAPDRSTTRRSERAGVDPGLAEVKVVALRRHASEGTPPPEGERRASEYSHRWIVQGHWRNQPYGPGRTQRRLQWIAPYVKGPEDAPLQAPEVVRAWVR